MKDTERGNSGLCVTHMKTAGNGDMPKYRSHRFESCIAPHFYRSYMDPKKDDVIRTVDDLKKALPDLPVFELPKLTGEEILEIMREQGDGTAQGET